MPPCLPSFLACADRSLLLFGGKGGVGKTTCAAAAALYLARQFPERSFLLASTDPAHSLRDCFAGPSSLPNLQYREIDFRACLQRFKEANGHHFRAVALEGTFLDEADVSQLMELSVPGFDEMMAFTEIAALLDDGAYSCVLIDTAPTGHTLRFLELPDLMRHWIHTLDALRAKHRYLVRLYRRAYRKDDTDVFLHDLAKTVARLTALLRAPDRCLFVPVMLAEALSTKETERLVGRLQALQVRVSDILVNRLYPAESSCSVCAAVRRRQQGELHEAVRDFVDYKLWGVPVHGGEVRGAEQLACFWEGLEPIAAAPTAPLPDPGPVPGVERPAPLPPATIALALFAGKGGVGKTTLACASALRLAREYPDRKVLLFSTDPAHSLADCLDRPIGPEEVSLAPGLTALEIDSCAEFEKLKRTYAHEVEAMFGALVDQAGIELQFDRDAVRRLLELSPPGLDEVMALLKAVELLETKKYDILVLDTAPTGHLLRWLELPEMIQGWLKAIFGLFLKYKNVFRLPRITDFLVGLSKKLKRLRGLLADPQTGQLFAVSILTEMAWEETCDLIAACRQTGLHVPALFLNLATLPGPCLLCTAVAETEAVARGRFAARFPDLNQTVVYRWGEPRGLERLAGLGQALYRK